MIAIEYQLSYRQKNDRQHTRYKMPCAQRTELTARIIPGLNGSLIWEPPVYPVVYIYGKGFGTYVRGVAGVRHHCVRFFYGQEGEK